jgi:ABC-type antimicrobial peptide transport system permease subunit
MAMSEEPFATVRVVVRTEHDPLPTTPVVAAVLRQLDPELAMAEIGTMDEIAAEAFSERRLTLSLFEAFALLATALAAFGIYGMLACSVQQRHKQVAIRVALGAGRASIVWMVLSEGALLAGIGVLLGVLSAPVATHLLVSLLFRVTGWDAITLTAAPLAMLSVALLASAPPAWAASRLRPMSILREQ